MAAFPSLEHRPLKKPRLGSVGPDVYPQDPKQKEDELTSLAVKQGFSNKSVIEDEHGSARSYMCDITEEKVGRLFQQILAKKTEANTFQDSGSAKKKQQLHPKDHFWPVTARSKNAIEAWFKDLSGSKALNHLAKKVPSFNKKEEIFTTLIEYQVPMIRAAWFIKMTSAYQVAICEARIRNKQRIDPSIDWAQAVCKFMKEQLVKILEHYQGSTTTTSFLTAGNTNCVDIDSAMKNWTYSSQLARVLYEENLLDRHEFLTWLLELLEKMKITDETVLRIVLHQILQYMSEFVQSQLLSRRLAHHCCRRIAVMISDFGCASPRTQSPMVTNGTNGISTSSANSAPVPNPAITAFTEYTTCAQHRSLLLDVCGIVQAITIRCSGSLVWHNFGEGKTNSVLCGSPLDLLPCAPSGLPMPQGLDNQILRSCLRMKEHQIRQRSRAAEVRWLSDKCQQSAAGFTISRVLNILEVLDRHTFDRVDSSNSMDSLYNKIYSATQPKDNSESPLGDEPILNILCEWAVSTQRTGEHRAVVVAKLLEKRQSDLAAEKMGDGEMLDEDSLESDLMGAVSMQPFQTLLMNFLDNKAPVLDANPTVENKLAFSNLVLLFAELIRHDVFSHDAYMNTLISRGDLAGSPALAAAGVAIWNADLSSVKSEYARHEFQEEIKMEIDNPPLDSDYELFPFKDDPGKPSPDQPASVKSERSAATPAQATTPAQAHTPGMGHTTPVQAHTPGAHTPGSHTPGAAHTPGGAHTPGMAHTPVMAHTPGVAHTPASVPPPSSQPLPDTPLKHPSKHLIYATHFPIPQDEAFNHECNQRMITLYGVGKNRDEARHMTKRITKDIMKLFSKKNSIDVSSGDVGKKGKKKEKEKEKDSDSSANLESTFNKFQKLSYFDQHAVTTQCAGSVCDQVQNFAAGSSQHQHLPLVEYVAYLFDLMEYAYNVNGLLVFVVSLLKELGEVEIQLQNKQSNLAGNYTTSLCLCIVAVLRKYHSYLLVSHEQTINAFDGLKAVKHVVTPSDCTSAERCILAYLYDLHTCCSFLRAKYSESFGNAIAKVKNTIYSSIIPSASNLLWEPAFLIDLIENPRTKPDASIVKQLNENPANRYSFVCNALLNICNCQNMERLNGISILCAELTACCNALSSEWLGVLKALCWSSNHSCGFIDVLTQVDVGDLSIHDSLAVFTAILIARHCFSLEDLVVHVALRSLLAACPTMERVKDQDAEQGARLTCHLLLRLFSSSHYQLGPAPPSSKNSCNIKTSCDRHLLAAAHNSITVGAVVAVLKAILMLGDSCNNTETKNKQPSSSNSEDIISSLLSSLDEDLDIMPRPTNTAKGGIESAGLNEYAKHALREICSQEWVRERFLKNPEELFKTDMLLDPELKKKHAQQLVQMICYPGGLPEMPDPDDDEDDDDDCDGGDGDSDSTETEQRRTITRILKNMDQWSLRVSWLELQLMFKQAMSQEMNSLLDNIAKGTIEVFQQQTEIDKENGINVPASWDVLRPELTMEGVWLVAPLVAKLPSSVQGRILKEAGQVLESGNNFWSAKTSKEKERNLKKSTSLLALQPFLSLVLTCLRGQDEQREGLLNTLHGQLNKFVENAKEPDKGLPEDGKIMAMMQEALQLRLSLVGSMFDTIQRSNSLTSDWAKLLLEIMSYGVVDTNSNSELFTIVLDMLSVLIHGTLVSENSERGEENKKSYMTLMKRLKIPKELSEKQSEGIDELRQLLLLPKRQVEVITVDHHANDSKSHKMSGADSADKKQGLQITMKQKVVPWDLLEGHKNPAPLSWLWFGAIKLEKKPLKYEEQHRLLLYHTHCMVKPASHFLEPPPLPPEDLEPPPPKEEEKPPEPVAPEVTKPESGTKKPKKQTRRRQPRPSPSNSTYMPQASMPPMFSSDTMYRAQGGWYPNQGHQAYTQQIPPGGPRFGSQVTTPKMALRGMINARQPPYIPPSSQQSMRIGQLPKHQQQAIIRHRLSMQHGPNMMNRMGDGGGGMYSQQPGPFSQHPQHISMQQNLTPGYGGYNSMQPQQAGMMEPSQPNMMSAQFQQPYQSSQPLNMNMPQQASYMGHQQPQMQQHFPPSSQTPPQSSTQQYQQQLQQQAQPSQQSQPQSQFQSTTQPTPVQPQTQRQYATTGGQQFNNMGSGTMQGQMAAGGMQGQIGSMGSMSGYSQLGPQGSQAPPQGPQGSSYMQGMSSHQQQRLQLQRQQQQLLALQQQQQQQQQQQHGQPQNQQQQPGVSLVAQLQQRHSMMSTGAQQPQPPQYQAYQQPPQY